MSRRIHFIAGLPRSGSTLLSALLRQNPAVYAHMSSPLAALVGGVQASLSAKSEFHPLIDDELRTRVINGLLESYYGNLPDTTVVFDTNRTWPGKLATLSRVAPAARVVCCVRPLPEIINSIEELLRRNPLEPSKMFNFHPGGTVYTRVEHINSPSGMLGSSYGLLKEAFYGPYADRLLIVPYNVLVRSPATVLNAVYDFIGIPRFSHDFINVELNADEFDRRMGLRGLHAVAGPVAPRQCELLLPPDLIHRFQHSHFWLEPERNPRGVKVVLADDAEPGAATTEGSNATQLQRRLPDAAARPRPTEVPT